MISHRRSGDRTYSGLANSRLCDIVMASTFLFCCLGYAGGSPQDVTDGFSGSSYLLLTGLDSEAKKGLFSTCISLRKQKPSWNPHVYPQAGFPSILVDRIWAHFQVYSSPERGINCHDWLTLTRRTSWAKGSWASLRPTSTRQASVSRKKEEESNWSGHRWQWLNNWCICLCFYQSLKYRFNQYFLNTCYLNMDREP